jgi:hypothetical protein
MVSLPRAPVPAITANGFVLCPIVAQPPLAAFQQAVYQLALEQAKAVVRPSLLERDLVGVWN